MRYIRPTEVHGTIAAPPSKSDGQRAVAAALLAAGTTVIDGVGWCDDLHAAVEVAGDLGATIDQRADSLEIRGGLNPRTHEFDCGESGLCLRVFAPIAALGGGEMTLHGRGSLMNRPAGMVESALTQLGVTCESRNGFPPIRLKGPLKSGHVKVDGGSTSQHISGLLFALPVVQGDSHVEVANPHSKPYLQMTLSTLERFGVRIEHDEALTNFFIRGGQSYTPVHYRLEGDWSGAAFMLVAGAVAGQVTVENLNPDSLQADRAILDALRQCGAEVLCDAAAVTVRKNELLAFEFDAHDSPDLVPPLAVLACYCQGTSLISGTERLKIKESNRTRALISELTKMGARVSEHEDCLRITGELLKGASVRTQGDHRIAMAAAVAALGAEQETVLDDADCVSKSYPNFFQDLETIGVKK